MWIPSFLQYCALQVVRAHQVLGFTAWLREVVLTCQKCTEWKIKGAVGSKEDIAGVRGWAQGEEG